MAESIPMLTGQEQYYLERAGYFIRRGMILDGLLRSLQGELEPSLSAGARIRDSIVLPQVMELLSDLHPVMQDALGQRLSFLGFEVVTSANPMWRRPRFLENQSDIKLPAEALARRQRNLFANVAILPDECAWVIPGSHVETLREDSLRSIGDDRTAGLPDAVCIRLSPGDVWFFNGCLAVRSVNETDVPLLTVQFSVIAEDDRNGSAPTREPEWVRRAIESAPATLKPVFERNLRSMHRRVAESDEPED